MSSHPIPPERVLPTLNNDGTRRWIRPKPYKGVNYKRRLYVGWGLIALFVFIPFARVGGAPAVLLDIPERKFHLLGATFLPTDGVLLMLALLAVFVSIFLVTALFGRVWCGWGCPQTVYMEFVFRPIEQWLEGSRGQQLKLDREGANLRRLVKFGIFALLSVLVANIFLAYFVGVSRLATWMSLSPFEHPTGFLVVAAVSSLVLFDFGYFREQMCTVVCPYARLQSVLLDKSSLIVGYDQRRGEPRGNGRNAGGDCIDCKACVITCPTGIDIRDGLQLECIGCTQCVDACDSVMTKLNKPTGLIRYANQTWFESYARSKILRPRVIVYPVLLAGLIAALLVIGRAHQRSEVTVLRGIGAPFVLHGEFVRNQLRIKIQNRADHAIAFVLTVADAGNSQIITPENPVTIAAGEHTSIGAFVLTPRTEFTSGLRNISVVVSEPGTTTTVPYKLLGPAN
jgi:cytochrome c oxidase accessory protein FixG